MIERIKSRIKEIQYAKATQVTLPTLWIPILCIFVGVLIGGIGERTTHITESIYPVRTESGTTEDYLRSAESEQRKSLEYNQSIQSHIDRSAEINSRAADTIRQIEAGQHFTSERIGQSKAELNRATGFLEENRRLFEQIDRAGEERQKENENNESTTESIGSSGRWITGGDGHKIE